MRSTDITQRRTDMAENTAKFTIDVTPVYCGEKKRIEFSYELPPESVAVGNDISFLTPVTASGSIAETVSGNGDSEGYVELALTGFYENRHSLRKMPRRCRKRLHNHRKVRRNAIFTERRGKRDLHHDRRGTSRYCFGRKNAVSFESSVEISLLRGLQGNMSGMRCEPQ